MPILEHPDALGGLLAIMRRLRDPESGCPWDLQQTFATIAPHTLEEAYEVVDAIESGDMLQLRSELGDLLFQVVFHAQLGSEQGLFDFDAVVEDIAAKLLRRHPHVFPAGEARASTTGTVVSVEQVAGTWEQIKAEERRQKDTQRRVSELDDVPLALAALPRAAKIQKRAAAVGFDWHDKRGVLAKLQEELGEFGQAAEADDGEGLAEEFGDILFTLVNLSRHLQLDAEGALRKATSKFEQRFRDMETALAADGRSVRDLSDTELDVRWQQAKMREKRR